MFMPESSPVAKSRDTLMQFVYLSLFVLQHPFFKEPHALEGWAFSEQMISLHPETGEEILTPNLPHPDRLDRLACRIRPLVLPGDSLHYREVLLALETLMVDISDAQWNSRLQQLRLEWVTAALQGDASVRFSVASCAHAEAHSQAKYARDVAMFCRTAVLVESTYAFVRDAALADLIPLSHYLFDPPDGRTFLTTP